MARRSYAYFLFKRGDIFTRHAFNSETIDAQQYEHQPPAALPCSECRLTWRITQRDKVLAKGTTTMTIAADSGTMVKTLTATPVGQDDVSIRFTIENSAGKIVGENQRTESVIK